MELKGEEVSGPPAGASEMSVVGVET